MATPGAADDDDLDGPANGNPFAAASPAGSPMNMSQMPVVLNQLVQTTQVLASVVNRTESATASHAITGREMSKILPKPEPFRASSREQECSQWPAWLWGLESRTIFGCA